MPGQAFTGIPFMPGWFKPYSLCDRKKGAANTVRHFCATAGRPEMRIVRLAVQRPLSAAGRTLRDGPDGRAAGLSIAPAIDAKRPGAGERMAPSVKICVAKCLISGKLTVKKDQIALLCWFRGGVIL